METKGDRSSRAQLEQRLVTWALNRRVALSTFEASGLHGCTDQEHPVVLRCVATGAEYAYAQRKLAERLGVDTEAIRVRIEDAAPEDLPSVEQIDHDLARARCDHIRGHQASARRRLREMANDPFYSSSPSMNQMYRRQMRYVQSFHPPRLPAPALVAATTFRNTRARGAGRPRASAARSSAKSGDSGDDGSGSEPPGETTGRPLLLVADPRWGRANPAMLRTLRKLAR